LPHRATCRAASRAVLRRLLLPLLAAAWAPGPRGLAQGFEAVPCNATTTDCGRDFYAQVYREFELAKEEVIIMPFFIRPRLKVFSSVEGQPPDETLHDLVVRAVKRGVHVWILGWDNSASEKYLNYHQDAEFEKLFLATGKDNEHLHLMLDTGRRLMAPVYYLPHIKSYAFDRKVAFVGGIDFAENRLDTPQHLRPDPRLVSVKMDKDHVTGNEKPWQDVMVRVDGAAAEHVAMVGIERWWTYCKSAGYMRSQAMRPFSAVADTLWKVPHSLSVSHWKTYQCAAHPAPATLGTLELSIRAGNTDRREVIRYKVDIVVPPVQSQDLPEAEAQHVSLTSGERQQVRVKGLRALDKPLPASITFQIDGEAFEAPSDREAEVKLIDGDRLHARWMPNGVLGPPVEDNIIGRAASEPQLCQVTLSGAHTWMGSERVMRGSLDAHLKIIHEAKRFVLIENQYFVTDFPQDSYECRHGDIRAEAVLYSGAQNRLGEVILDKLKHAARTGSDFNMAIIVPLGTEPGSFYPNLRSTFCFEQAVEEVWKREQFQSDWRDYFSFFFIANAVKAPKDMGGPGSAFYGIFTHTKAIVADDEVALVGSANINDRSFNGDRDAEVGVLVSGGSYPRRFRETLLKGHLGDASLADPKRLLASLRRVAESNAAALKASMGISFPEGTVERPGGQVKQLFGLKGVLELSAPEDAVLAYPDSRVVAGGGGNDMFKWYVVPGAEPPKLQGLLFPWSRSIWGLPKMTQVGQLLSNELNWRRRLEERRENGSKAHPGTPAAATAADRPLLV